MLFSVTDLHKCLYNSNDGSDFVRTQSSVSTLRQVGTCIVWPYNGPTGEVDATSAEQEPLLKEGFDMAELHGLVFFVVFGL